MKTNIYKDCQFISIEHAIQVMVELSLPRGTQNKVLVIPVKIAVENNTGNIRNVYELAFIIERSSNYTFVGLVDNIYDVVFPSGVPKKVKYLSYHDSCWRDAFGNEIRKIARKAENDFKSNKNVSIFISFQTPIGPRIINAYIEKHDDIDNNIIHYLPQPDGNEKISIRCDGKGQLL